MGGKRDAGDREMGGLRKRGQGKGRGPGGDEAGEWGERLVNAPREGEGRDREAGGGELVAGESWGQARGR